MTAACLHVFTHGLPDRGHSGIYLSSRGPGRRQGPQNLCWCSRPGWAWLTLNQRVGHPGLSWPRVGSGAVSITGQALNVQRSDLGIESHHHLLFRALTPTMTNVIAAAAIATLDLEGVS